MRKILLASVSAAVLSSSAVMAADMPVKARPLPAPPPTWTGFYVGLNAGYAWGHSDIAVGDLAVDPFDSDQIAAPNLSPKGFIGGGQAGYNWQTGQWVVGGEIDFSGLDAKADASVSPFFTGKGNAFTWSTRYDWLFTARLRAGYLVAPNWLLYATGGLAITHVKDSVVCTSAAIPDNQCGLNSATGSAVTWSDSETLTAGTIGGGIETMFLPNWTARVEYLYAKFKDTTPPVTSSSGFGPGQVFPSVFSFSHNLNVIRFAINYKFNP
jgi:outer membrane immunogenic protein